MKVSLMYNLLRKHLYFVKMEVTAMVVVILNLIQSRNVVIFMIAIALLL